MFSSSSLTEHLLRGLLAVAAVIGSISLLAAGTVLGCSVALLSLAFAVVMMRGCPMCWTMGLLETISASRTKSRCEKCSVPVRDSDNLRT